MLKRKSCRELSHDSDLLELVWDMYCVTGEAREIWNYAATTMGDFRYHLEAMISREVESNEEA